MFNPTCLDGIRNSEYQPENNIPRCIQLPSEEPILTNAILVVDMPESSTMGECRNGAGKKRLEDQLPWTFQLEVFPDDPFEVPPFRLCPIQMFLMLNIKIFQPSLLVLCECCVSKQ